MKKLKYHFIGICGASMSALAVYLKNKGNYVQGSDLSNYVMKQKLEKNGIVVFDGHNKKNVGNVDVVVYNFAIKSNNEELIEAKKKKIKILSRAQLLSFIANDFKCVISVAGSHGKTTTTAMLFSCLNCAKKEPSLHIGAQLKDQDFGFVLQKNKFFITEACEYKDSFLQLNSNISIILNIEPEHLDYFKTYKNEVKSFNEFAKNSNKVICINNDIINKKDYTFGDENSDIYAKNIKIINHKYNFDCFYKNNFFIHIELGAVGLYNVTNALSVIMTCIILKIPKKYIAQGLKEFRGIKRRFEVLGNEKNFVVHDYAHHPTEIKKTITTFKENVGDKKILVVFQPHTFSRTKNLYNDFLSCFNGCDKLLLVKTYPAREKYDKYSSAYSLYKNIKNIDCSYCASFSVAIKKIEKYLQKKFAVLILGAGNIDEVAYKLSDILHK